MDLLSYLVAPRWRRKLYDIARAHGRVRALPPTAAWRALWLASNPSSACLRCGGDCWHSGWCVHCAGKGNASGCTCATYHLPNDPGPAPTAGRYSGWRLLDRVGLMDELAKQGAGPVHPHLDLEHITFEYGPGAQLPDEIGYAWVVAVAADDRVQALICTSTLDGDSTRPDGGTYHVTYSLAPQARPVESNVMLALAPSRPLAPILVPVEAFLRGA